MEEALRFILVLCLWISGAVALVFVGVRYLGMPDDLYLLVIMATIAFFAFKRRPFYRMRFSPSVDLSVIIICAVTILLYLGALVVGPNIEQEAAMETCGSQTNEKKCYSLPKLVCENMWEKYEGECLREIKKDLGDRATALAGPATKKCIQRRFDKSLYYTRKTIDPACQAYFQTIKD